jgi:DNA polymerase-3 subunit alpha
VTLGGIVSGVKRGTTKRGDGKITFVIEDLSGSVEVVFVQKSNGKSSQPPEDDAVVLVTGRVSQQEETYRIFADEIGPLEIRQAQGDRVLYIRINSRAGNPEAIERLQVLCINRHGPTPVLLYFVRQKTLVKAAASFWVDATPDLCYQIEGLCGPGSCFVLERQSEPLSQRA